MLLLSQLQTSMLINFILFKQNFITFYLNKTKEVQGPKTKTQDITKDIGEHTKLNMTVVQLLKQFLNTQNTKPHRK